MDSGPGVISIRGVVRYAAAWQKFERRTGGHERHMLSQVRFKNAPPSARKVKGCLRYFHYMASFSDQGFRCFVVVILTAVAYYLLVVNMSPTFFKISSPRARSESCDLQFPQNNSADMYGRIFANGTHPGLVFLPNMPLLSLRPIGSRWKSPSSSDKSGGSAD